METGNGKVLKTIKIGQERVLTPAPSQVGKRTCTPFNTEEANLAESATSQATYVLHGPQNSERGWCHPPRAPNGRWQFRAADQLHFYNAVLLIIGGMMPGLP